MDTVKPALDVSVMLPGMKGELEQRMRLAQSPERERPDFYWTVGRARPADRPDSSGMWNHMAGTDSDTAMKSMAMTTYVQHKVPCLGRSRINTRRACVHLITHSPPPHSLRVMQIDPYEKLQQPPDSDVLNAFGRKSEMVSEAGAKFINW